MPSRKQPKPRQRPARKPAKRAAAKKSTTRPAAKKKPARRTAAPWPFDQPPNTAALTLRRIVLPKRGSPPRPILFVSHDTDGMWQFLDGDDMTTKDAAVVGLDTMLQHDPTLAAIADLPPGWLSTRASPAAKWKRQRQST